MCIALILRNTRHQQAGDHMMRLQNLTPPQLAGVLGAIMTGENISKPQVWAAYEPTPAVIAAVQALEGDREQLYKAQVQHGIQAPLSMDLRLAGEHCHCCCHCPLLPLPLLLSLPLLLPLLPLPLPLLLPLLLADEHVGVQICSAADVVQHLASSSACDLWLVNG